MRFASFATADGGTGFGVADGDAVLDVSASRELGAGGPASLGGLALRTGARHRLDGVRLLPPVTDAERILCIGLNFTDHAAEAKIPLPAQPAFFIRFPSSFVGHGDDIIAPAVSDEFDFEGEIALVIGTSGYRIPPEAALNHVLGVTILADNSARDWQRHSRQVTAGKNFPRSGAIGPWCVTLDEGIDLGTLPIVTRLHGETVQRGSTADLIFGAEQAVAYASAFTPLAAGDLIALGTPAGVGMAHTPPLWMRPGDLLEVEVPGIGTLADRVVAEAASRQTPAWTQAWTKEGQRA